MTRIRTLLTAAAALALALCLLPSAARAGTYHVYACAAGGSTFANNSWAATAVSGVVEDATCDGGTIGLSVPAGATMADNTAAGLTFTSPAGTTIADFSLTRQLDYTDTATSGTHQYYALYQLGATVFAGAGDYNNATRTALSAQKQWYGYPTGTAHVAKTVVSKASFPALGSYAGTANQLSIHAGCYSRGTTCTVATGGKIVHQLFGADVTVSDSTPPVETVEASGLLAGGPRDGSDPVTLSATDASGIRRVDVIDVTAPSAPFIAGSEDYADVRTDAGRGCDYSLPAPCPALSRETLRPTALPAGERTVIVRATDTAGNIVDRGPFTVDALTPSDRGALNGTNATDAAVVQVAFTHGAKTHRLVGYGERVGVHGKLINAAGQPIGGATVVLFTRDMRPDAPVVERTTLTTAADGSFLTNVSATASRLLQIGWYSHTRDVRLAANGYLTLEARASGRLAVSTRHPRVGAQITVSGQLRGVSRGGVTVVVQGRPRSGGAYETFADTTTSRSGRFKVHYRFRNAGSRGREFVFRARIRPGAHFPYRTGYSNRVTVRVR
jgi:hypothetical protein